MCEGNLNQQIHKQTRRLKLTAAVHTFFKRKGGWVPFVNQVLVFTPKMRLLQFLPKLAQLTNSNTFASPTEWRIPEKVAGWRSQKSMVANLCQSTMLFGVVFFVRARCLSADLRSWVLLADQRGIEPPPAVCQRHKSAAIPTAPRGRLCCLELFWCCCRRLSQHGMGEMLIPLRNYWWDAFFLRLPWQLIVLSWWGVALLSFVLVSWCVVSFCAPPLHPSRLLQ